MGIDRISHKMGYHYNPVTLNDKELIDYTNLIEYKERLSYKIKSILLRAGIILSFMVMIKSIISL